MISTLHADVFFPPSVFFQAQNFHHTVDRCMVFPLSGFFHALPSRFQAQNPYHIVNSCIFFPLSGFFHVLAGRFQARSHYYIVSLFLFFLLSGFFHVVRLVMSSLHIVPDGFMCFWFCFCRKSYRIKAAPPLYTWKCKSFFNIVSKEGRAKFFWPGHFLDIYQINLYFGTTRRGILHSQGKMSCYYSSEYCAIIVRLALWGENKKQ